MARVPDLDPAGMSGPQRELYDAIASVRGGAVRGPFAIWMRTPEIADAANNFGNALRLNSQLDKRLFEIAVLVVARHWNAQYEWFVHARHAAEFGVSDAIIEAIRTGATPPFERDDEALVFKVASELMDTKTLSDATYSEAEAALGLEILIELVTSIGFYASVAMMLNAFDAPVPGGARPLD